MIQLAPYRQDHNPFKMHCSEGNKKVIKHQRFHLSVFISIDWKVPYTKNESIRAL